MVNKELEIVIRNIVEQSINWSARNIIQFGEPSGILSIVHDMFPNTKPSKREIDVDLMFSDDDFSLGIVNAFDLYNYKEKEKFKTLLHNHCRKVLFYTQNMPGSSIFKLVNLDKNDFEFILSDTSLNFSVALYRCKNGKIQS